MAGASGKGWCLPAPFGIDLNAPALRRGEPDRVYNDHLYIGEYNAMGLYRTGAHPFAKTGKNDRSVWRRADRRFINANLEQSVNLYRMDRTRTWSSCGGNATKMFSGSLSGLKSGFGRNENL